MATKMGIRELRDGLTSVIRRVRSGETIEITHHGETVALLSPVPDDRIERLIATGVMTRGEPLGQLPKREPALSGLTSEEILADDRDGR
jgi:prevent-host-death family protein